MGFHDHFIPFPKRWFSGKYGFGAGIFMDESLTRIIVGTVWRDKIDIMSIKIYGSCTRILPKISYILQKSYNSCKNCKLSVMNWYKPTKFHQTLQGLGDFAAATAAGVMSLEEGSGNLRGVLVGTGNQVTKRISYEYDFPIQKIWFQINGKWISH